LFCAHNVSLTQRPGSLPILYDDGVATATGFEDIIAYLRNHLEVTEDLDADLTNRQLIDRIALVHFKAVARCKLTRRSFITFLQSTATPLIDLSLYVSAENYNTTTSSAYTAILPWFANYTVPPKRRDLARTRTAHMGLSSLDVDTTAAEGFAPGRGTASSEYEAAKRAAGIPTDGQPSTMRMGRGRGIGGFPGTPVYAARFKLDALSNELLEPLSDLLGRTNYLLNGDELSSLDCLAFGYLSLLYYPAVPQTWLRETIQTKFPRIASYLRRLREVIFANEEVKAADVWTIANSSSDTTNGMLLPWRAASQSLTSNASSGVREIIGNMPLISSFTQTTSIIHLEPRQTSKSIRSTLPSHALVNSLLGITAAATVGLAALAVHHRRSPRDGALIFWALRPSTGLGEAGSILSVLASPGGVYSQF
jgi:hypothetical protein